MTRPFVVAALVVILLQSGSAAPTVADSALFDQIAQQGIREVYNLEFERADSSFSTIVRMRPHDPAGYFFCAMVDWWRILIDIDNTAHDDSFFDALDHVIDLCDSMLDRNENDVTAMFFKGGALGFKGRLKFHRDDWLAAANAGRKALPLVQGASTADPGNYDIFLGTGIYDYYAAVIPEEYPFAKPLLLFIPAGDRQKGIHELTLAAEKGKYASVEATYFLMQLYYQFEKNYQKALVLALSLHDRFPNNMLFHKYVGRCYVSLGGWADAGRIFREIIDRCERRQRGYGASTEREAVYYEAIYDMQENRYEDALRLFSRCEALSRTMDSDGPSGFQIMSKLKIGNLYDLMSQRDKAVQQYEAVRALKEYKGSTKLAEQYLKTPYRQ